MPSRCAPEAPAGVLPREGVESLHSPARAHRGPKEGGVETSHADDEAARRGSHHQRSPAGAFLPAAQGLATRTAGSPPRQQHDSSTNVGRASARSSPPRSSSTPSSCRVATGPCRLPGCRREDREEERMRGRGATMHAVVCYAYGRSNKAGCVS